MKTLDDFLPLDTFSDALNLARTKYQNDPSIQTWLRIYEQGTHEIKTSKGKIKGIPRYSDYAKSNLRKAIQLREERKVYKHKR